MTGRRPGAARPGRQPQRFVPLRPARNPRAGVLQEQLRAVGRPQGVCLLAQSRRGGTAGRVPDPYRLAGKLRLRGRGYRPRPPPPRTAIIRDDDFRHPSEFRNQHETRRVIPERGITAARPARAPRRRPAGRTVKPLRRRRGPLRCHAKSLSKQSLKIKSGEVARALVNAGTDALEVWLDGRVVADLTMNRRRVPQLRYRADFAASYGAGALGFSVPLPVAVRPYKGEVVDYWIESLLPEGETRTVLERYFRVRRGDGFALLAAIGRDCAGAVAVTPFGQDLSETAVPLQPLTSGEVGEAVATLRQHPLPRGNHPWPPLREMISWGLDSDDAPTSLTPPSPDSPTHTTRPPGSCHRCGRS